MPQALRSAAVGSLSALIVVLLAASIVGHALPGTVRDTAALVLIEETKTMSEEDIQQWLCRTAVGNRFRLMAREILARHEIDSRKYCDKRFLR